MGRRRLQTEWVASPLTLPLSLVGVLLVWMLTGVFGLADAAPAFIGLLGRDGVGTWLSSPWVSHTVALLGYVLLGYMMLELNNAYAVIRMRTSLQVSLTGWLLAASPTLLQSPVGAWVSASVAVSLYFLFRSYQQADRPIYLFRSAAYLGLGSLLFPPLLLLEPVCLLGAYLFRSLTWRGFFAAVLGLCLPYAFLLGYAYWWNRMDLFTAPFADLALLRQPLSFAASGSVWTLWGVMLLLLLVGSLHYFGTSNDDKIRTRNYLHFLVLLGVVLFALSLLLMGQAVVWLAALLPVVSLVGAHLFALSHSKASNLFFLFYIISLLAVFSFCVWSHSCRS